MSDLETPQGVKEFNLCALSILGKLWEEFPRPLDFYTTHPNGVRATADRASEGTPFGEALFSSSELFVQTMNWLLVEEFLRTERNGRGQYLGVSLTTKGFTVLNEAPRSLQGGTKERPLGTIIREAVAAHAADVASKLFWTCITGHRH